MMDRRKYLKTLAVGTVGTLSAASLIESCKPEDKIDHGAPTPTIDRTPAELEHDNKLATDKFFDDHEMKNVRQDMLEHARKMRRAQALHQMPEHLLEDLAHRQSLRAGRGEQRKPSHFVIQFVAARPRTLKHQNSHGDAQRNIEQVIECQPLPWSHISTR